MRSEESVMKIAAEVMDRGAFYIWPSDSIGSVLREMGERGMGSAPVVDRAGRPLGVATVAEIEGAYDVEELGGRLTRAALCMDQGASIDAIARALASNGADFVVLVDAEGLAVGSLGSSEVLRCLLGEDVTRREELHQREADWEQADLFELGAAHRAPQAPGVILLSRGAGADGKRTVWAEAAPNMRERLDEMLRKPQGDARLERMLEAYPRSVRFRCLTVHDADRRDQVASALCNVEQGSAARAPMEPEVAALAAHVTVQGEPSATMG
jgi:CBS domain-containing protein